jgi:hypothetical protein
MQKQTRPFLRSGKSVLRVAARSAVLLRSVAPYFSTVFPRQISLLDVSALQGNSQLRASAQGIGRGVQSQPRSYPRF